MMRLVKYSLLFILINSNLYIFSQEFYLGIPDVKVNIHKGDVIVLPKLGWDYNRSFSTEGQKQLEKIIDLTQRYPSFDFEIVLFGDEKLLNKFQEHLLEIQASLAKETILNHKNYNKNVMISVSECLENKFEFSSNNGQDKYDNFYKTLSQRVEVRFN